MLAEGFVALIALVTIMIVAQGDIKRGTAPGTIYGNGIGGFLTLLIGEGNRNFAVTFGAMAFSTFVFDTLASARASAYMCRSSSAEGARRPVVGNLDRRVRST